MWPLTPGRGLDPGREHLMRELRRLCEAAGEHGAEAGLRALPGEAFETMTRAKIRALADEAFTDPGPEDEVWLAREQDLEQRRSTVLRAIETLEVRRSAERAAMGALMTQGWRPPVALALVAALTGLGLDAGAVAVGWRGWSILALLWALVSLVLPGVPAVVTAGAAGARAFIANLGARRQARRLAGEIAACRRDRTTAAERRRRLQSWIAASSELVLSEYRVQRERGGRAGTLAMESLV